MHAPFMFGFAITPSDTVAVAKPCDAIYVGGAGDVTVILAGDTAAVTFKAPPVGTVLDIKPKYVRAATTATLLIGLSRG